MFTSSIIYFRVITYVIFNLSIAYNKNSRKSVILSIEGSFKTDLLLILCLSCTLDDNFVKK